MPDDEDQLSITGGTGGLIIGGSGINSSSGVTGRSASDNIVEVLCKPGWRTGANSTSGVFGLTDEESEDLTMVISESDVDGGRQTYGCVIDRKEDSSVSAVVSNMVASESVVDGGRHI